MRAAKYRLLIALSSGNALQNPYGPLSRSTHYLFATPQLRSRISKTASTLFSATNKMQCTSKLGEMLSLSRNTQDEFDKTLMKMISIASGASSGAHLAALPGSKDLSASRCLELRPSTSFRSSCRTGTGRP